MVFNILIILLSVHIRTISTNNVFNSYQELLSFPLQKIQQIALLTKAMLPEETEYPFFPTQLSELNESLIMHQSDYMFWLVTMLDLEALHDFLTQKPIIPEINVQPMKWAGHSLVTYLMELGRTRRMMPVLSLLMKHGADAARFQRYTGSTVLISAASQNNVQLTRYFSRFDTYSTSILHATTTNGSTALHYAVEAGANQAARILMESPSLLNQRNTMGNTALHRAVAKNSQPLVKKLIAAGAYPVILNKFHEDPLIKAFEIGNQLIIFTLLETPLYKTGMMLNKNTIRSRITRIHNAFSSNLPELYIKHLLEPEFQSNETILCRIRDPQRRNIISMAIDNQYYTVLGFLLDHFKKAYEKKLPLWQYCNVHEPCNDNIYPLEKYVRTFDQRTQSAVNLRKLMNMMVPVDGTSALMHAIRHKGAELVLSNFIPFGVKDVLLSDLQLSAHETGAEAWGHNALTLASEIPKGGGGEISRRLLNLMALGLIGNVTEITHAFLQSLSTASRLKDSVLIQSIAKQAAPAVQLWYCTSTNIRAIETQEATFLTNSLPLTFPGFSRHVPCSPIVHHVELAVDSLQEKRIPRVDIIEALIRVLSIQWNPGRSILKALRKLGRTQLPEDPLK